MENGLQFLYKSDKIDADLWLNWQDFIKEGDDFQERFQVGLRSDFLIFEKENINVQIPVQFLFTHKGGEIDISDEQVLSIINAMTGLQLNILNKRGNNLSFELKYYRYKGVQLPDNSSISFDEGYALSPRISYKSNKIKASVSYWNADNFFAPGGE